MGRFLRTSREILGVLARGLVDPRNSLARRGRILGGFLASGVRLAAGTVVGRLGPRPELPMVLWDFERCPFSRAVRESLSSLDIDAEIRPCPKGGVRFRSELNGEGVPRLLDPNTGERISGSRAIITYLHKRYGVGRPPRFMVLAPVVQLTGLLMRLLTSGIGAHVRPSRAPAEALELWSFESSPFCRFARARLSELELPYMLHNVAKGSKRRKQFVVRSGKMQFPYLVDPNTRVAMFESQDIVDYLTRTYGVPGDGASTPAPVENKPRLS